METINTVLVALLGLAVGSFIGALSYRFTRGINIGKGRSFCPNCKAQIAWYNNIPLLSYVRLGGKCANCGKKISLRYPIIEGVVALGFLFIFSYSCSPASLELVCQWKDSTGVLYLPFLFFIFSFLVAIFVIDLEGQIIPDSLVFTLFVVTFLLLLSGNGLNLFTHLLSGFAAALFLLSLFLITKQKGMGLGDVKLVLWGGVFLGWPQTVSWLFVSFLIGAAVGLVLILAKKASFGKHIPFGPFLVVSFLIVVFRGENILRWLGI